MSDVAQEVRNYLDHVMDQPEYPPVTKIVNDILDIMTVAEAQDNEPLKSEGRQVQPPILKFIIYSERPNRLPNTTHEVCEFDPSMRRYVPFAKTDHIDDAHRIIDRMQEWVEW